MAVSVSIATLAVWLLRFLLPLGLFYIYFKIQQMQANAGNYKDPNTYHRDEILLHREKIKQEQERGNVVAKPPKCFDNLTMVTADQYPELFKRAVKGENAKLSKEERREERRRRKNRDIDLNELEINEDSTVTSHAKDLSINTSSKQMKGSETLESMENANTDDLEKKNLESLLNYVAFSRKPPTPTNITSGDQNPSPDNEKNNLSKKKSKKHADDQDETNSNNSSLKEDNSSPEGKKNKKNSKNNKSNPDLQAFAKNSVDDNNLVENKSPVNNNVNQNNKKNVGKTKIPPAPILTSGGVDSANQVIKVNEDAQMVLKGALKFGRVEVANQLYDQLTNQNIDIAFETYDLFVRICVKGNALQRASDYLIKMESAGHCPDASLLDEVMELYTQHKSAQDLQNLRPDSRKHHNNSFMISPRDRNSEKEDDAENKVQLSRDAPVFVPMSMQFNNSHPVPPPPPPVPPPGGFMGSPPGHPFFNPMLAAAAAKGKGKGLPPMPFELMAAAAHAAATGSGFPNPYGPGPMNPMVAQMMMKGAKGKGKGKGMMGKGMGSPAGSKGGKSKGSKSESPQPFKPMMPKKESKSAAVEKIGSDKNSVDLAENSTDDKKLDSPEVTTTKIDPTEMKKVETDDASNNVGDVAVGA